MDFPITIFFNTIAHASPLTEGITVFLARYLPYLLGIFFVFAAVQLAVTKRERVMLLFEGAAAALISRFVFVELFRLFLHRPRPFVADPSLVPLLSETSFSFPSGHASFFFALATVAYLYNKRLGVWFYIAGLAIGLARVAAGAHYPTDILGGAALGVAVGWLVHRLFLRLRSRTL
jgi:undecaprenyl-diphosphatase